MDQPTPDPPGKPASEDVTAVLVRGAVIFNALMPERFDKPSPLWNTLIPGKSEEFHAYTVIAPPQCGDVRGDCLCGRAPAQIPACGITALGSYLRCVAAKRACRGRGARCGSGVSACTVDRFGVTARRRPSEPVILCAGISPVASYPAGVVTGWSRRAPGEGSGTVRSRRRSTIWRRSTQNPWTMSSGGRPPSAVKWR